MTLSVDRIQGLSGSLAIKRPVACATTANIVLNGLQTIDGFVLASGDRVLVKNQTTGSENGVYEADTSDWRRTLDFDKSNDVVHGTLVNVIGGSTNYGLWILSTASPVVGTSSLVFERFEGFEGADQVVYVPEGAGAVATTVQAKQRESKSVEDFDAAGDGVTDDASAIQAAIDAIYALGGGDVVLQPKTYLISESIYMKRGVRLIGKGPLPTIPSFYLPATEAVIQGISTLRASSALTGAIVIFDFSATTAAERPHAAEMHNLMLDGTDMVSGRGVWFKEGPAGGGAFGNGECSDVATLFRVAVTRIPEEGIYQERDVNTVTYRDCKVAFCDKVGIVINQCADTKILNCQVFDCYGGVWFNGTQTARIHDNDIFNIRYSGSVTHSGVGFTDDSNYLIATNNYIQNCAREGVRIIASSLTSTNRWSSYAHNRITGNSAEANNGFDNLYIGSYGGVGLGGITFTGDQFSSLTNSEFPANKARYGFYLDAAPTTAIQATNCIFPIFASNAQLNDVALTYVNFVNCTNGGQSYIGNLPHTFADTGGNLSWQPNVTLGATFFDTANTAATVITGFSGSSQGREIWLQIADANTGVDFTGSNLKGNGGSDLAAGAGANGKVLHCKCYDGTNWACQLYG